MRRDLLLALVLAATLTPELPRDRQQKPVPFCHRCNTFADRCSCQRKRMGGATVTRPEGYEPRRRR